MPLGRTFQIPAQFSVFFLGKVSGEMKLLFELDAQAALPGHVQVLGLFDEAEDGSFVKVAVREVYNKLVGAVREVGRDLALRQVLHVAAREVEGGRLERPHTLEALQQVDEGVARDPRSKSDVVTLWQEFPIPANF